LIFYSFLHNIVCKHLFINLDVLYKLQAYENIIYSEVNNYVNTNIDTYYIKTSMYFIISNKPCFSCVLNNVFCLKLCYN